MKRKNTKPLLYLQLAGIIEQQIHKEVLKVGDKLPSIRTLCRLHGVSMSTAQSAFHSLERKALIESRPQSGYYVSNSFRRKLDIPGTSDPFNKQMIRQPRDVYNTLYTTANRKNITSFARGIPSPDILPIARLNKELIRAVRELPGSGVNYEPLQGNERLRSQVAKRSLSWKGNLTEEDIITSSGCINGIAYCLMALTKRGDKIAVESPCFYGTLQLANGLGLEVLEIPTSPATGMDPDALRKTIRKEKIKACILVSNFNNPLGSLMPDEHKKETVRLLEQYQVPLIEDDLYGDLYFGNSRPVCCKSFDESGNVLLCSSFSKTLAPGYRVGWVAPGKYKESVLRMKLSNALFCTSLTHETIAGFLENGRYDAHLRQLRQTLHTNFLQFVRVISQSFPEGTKISRPQGGLSVWVELPKKINTMDLYEEALRHKVSFSPGELFTLKKQFTNHMRLGYGMLWTDKTESALRTIGKLATAGL